MELSLEPGSNCWRVERASRVAVLVDAAGYFEALADALERAERTVLVLGWDIHSQLRLGSRVDEDEGEALAELLDRITRERPELEVRILLWDPAPIYLFDRELLPSVAFDFKTGQRVTLRLDDDHPTGASHHQKVVVIDDRIAFAGGIDLAPGRWDTPQHIPDDPRRRDPDGEAYGPFHDVHLAVDGDLAGALGDLARERWERATGERLPASKGSSDPWPLGLDPGAKDVRVAIARTEGAREDRPAVREIERLYLDAVRAAERTLYVENQYLTSETFADALVERLEAEEGPEIVIVTPREQSGRLEQATMGKLRARTVRRLRAADTHDRLRLYSPVVDDDVAIHVHAKVMIVDDEILCVGSANTSNRSMGLDTECNLAIVAEDDAATRAWIAEVRNGLLAEHLGTEQDRVADAIRTEESLVAAIEALRDGDRTLVDLEVELDDTLEELLPDDDVVDPDQPLDDALFEALASRVLSSDGADEG